MGGAKSKSSELRLDEALAKGWVEFWYQPKINLLRKQLAGLETLARVRHPELGVVAAKAIMATATTEAATALSEQALISALKTSQRLREIGLSEVSFAINMQFDALVRLPLNGLTQKYCGLDSPPRLIFDIGEKQVMAHISEIHAVEKKLKRHGFNLAIDDFGAAFMATREVGDALHHTHNVVCENFRRLAGGKFAEMKLNQSIVAHCNKSERKRKICENIIRLAHSMGANAVAVGIEKKKDLETLEELKCDTGQGFLLGAPISEQDLVSSLRQRAVKRDNTKPKRRAAA
jgi:EAL domain-containing protein (putative c-di-GMP-specific phosphodiesterase class I)